MLYHVSEFPSFLRLNDIPLYFMPCCVYPFLGGLHFLAVMNNAAVDMVYQHPFSSLLSVLLGTCPGVELLDHVVVLGLNF